MNRPIHIALRAAATLALCVGIVSCQDESVQPPDADLPQEVLELPAGIHPILSVPKLASATEGTSFQIHLHLRAVDVEGPIASYQGELRYDPEALEVEEGSFPDGLAGAWNEVRPGVVRFAGVIREGLGDRPALTLSARALRPLDKGDFAVEVEEVVAAETFHNLTGQIPETAGATIVDALLAPSR